MFILSSSHLRGPLSSERCVQKGVRRLSRRRYAIRSAKVGLECRPIMVLTPCIAPNTASIMAPPDHPVTSGASPLSGQASTTYTTFQSPLTLPPYFSVKSLVGIFRPVGCSEDHRNPSLLR